MLGEGREREEEGSKQETAERASSRCSENTSRLRSRWVAVCVEMKQGVGGRVKNKHTLFLPVIPSPLLPDPAAHVPTRVGVAGGGKKIAHPAPTPKYKQLSLNQNCLSRLSPALAREGHMASDLRLATRGGGGPSNRPGRGVSPRTRKTGVSTSKQLGGHRREWVGPGS